MRRAWVNLSGWILALVFFLIWINGRSAVDAVSTELQSVKRAYEQLQNEYSGLEAANTALANRRFPADLPSPPEPGATIPDRLVDESTHDPEPATENRPAEEEAIQTAEEIAAEEAQRAEREQRRQEWAQRRQEFGRNLTKAARTRFDFLAQIDTEGLAPDYIQSHELLLESLATAEQIVASMGNETLSEDERRNLRRNLPALMRTIDELMGVEREILFNDYAISLNLGDRESEAFIAAMQLITDMTTPPRFFGSRGRGER